nr:hypothetical protein [Acinetobacter oleivorans]
MIKEFPYGLVQLAVNLAAKKNAINLGIELDPVAPAYMQLSNYLSKRIKAAPRKVAVSKKFIIPTELLEGYEKLVEKIKNGEDINIYLSKKIEETMFSDRFLDDFGCVHFHLGSTLEKGYIKRTGPIALAFVTNDEIFFIEIKPHGPYTWTDKSVLEILNEERPHFIARNKATLLKDVSPAYSDAETIKNLRTAGYTFVVTLDDGSVVMPSKLGSVTVRSSDMNKSSMLAVEHMNRMMLTTREIYFMVNQYIKNFKLEKNCTITNVEIINLETNKNDLLRIDKFDIQIHYLKEFGLFVHKVSKTRE